MMKNLRTAISAFWCILANKPHVYCDNSQHSAAGTGITAKKQIDLLIVAVTQEIGQQQVLNEFRNLVNK